MSTTNPITSAAGTYQAAESYQKTSGSKAAEAKTQSAAETAETSAAVYEKSGSGKAARSSSKNKNYVTLSKENQNIVAQLKADAQQRSEQLRSLVESMISKQYHTFNISQMSDSKMYEMLRTGQLNVSPEIRAQAQKDIADDGYWGVEQTSERLFSFAKAISGGDTSKAETLIKAMEKGFRQATKSWGDKLPSICQRTLESATEKIRNWAKETSGSDDMTDAAQDAFQNQAAQDALSR